jgi:choline dehydrogenase-like flavoprotein
MFVDFADHPRSSTLTTDICLVGAGVMGLALATHLLRHTSRRIVLVEQGGLIDTDALSEVPEELNNGDIDSGIRHSRAQGFGGSSRRWGGEALPFLPTDLYARDANDLRNSWPLTFDELKPYYQMSADFLRLSSIPFEADLWNNNLFNQWFGATQKLEINFSKHSPIAYLANQYRSLFSRSRQATCLIHAKVVEILLDATGRRAQALRVRSAAGQEALLQAQMIVLCSGGIENPRLLLASKQGDRHGIGNQQDLVGRYYQDHVGFYGARLEPINFGLFKHLFASFLSGNQKYLPKLQLSQQHQLAHGFLNVTGNIAVEDNDHSPLQIARRLTNTLKSRQAGSADWNDVRRLVLSPQSFLPVISSSLRGRVYFPYQANYFLIGNAESEPLWDSRILLSDLRDDHGMAKPLVQWRVSERTREALCAYFGAVKTTLEGAGIAKVIVTPFLHDPNLPWKQKGYSLYHHMGATRMAHSPREGVVDGHCRVHGVDNLYVAGTSVLPTGSASNPTFTALALTFRLGQHLVHQLRV